MADTTSLQLSKLLNKTLNYEKNSISLTTSSANTIELFNVTSEYHNITMSLSFIEGTKIDNFVCDFINGRIFIKTSSFENDYLLNCFSVGYFSSEKKYILFHSGGLQQDKTISITMSLKINSGLISLDGLLNKTGTPSSSPTFNLKINDKSTKLTNDLHIKGKVAIDESLIVGSSITANSISISGLNNSGDLFLMADGSTESKTDLLKFPTPTTWTWTTGTTSGPTASITGTNLTEITVPAIPWATYSSSGIVTTGDQVFSGTKTFPDGVKTVSIEADSIETDSFSCKNVSLKNPISIGYYPYNPQNLLEFSSIPINDIMNNLKSKLIYDTSTTINSVTVSAQTANHESNHYIAYKYDSQFSFPSGDNAFRVKVFFKKKDGTELMDSESLISQYSKNLSGKTVWFAFIPSFNLKFTFTEPIHVSDFFNNYDIEIKYYTGNNEHDSFEELYTNNEGVTFGGSIPISLDITEYQHSGSLSLGTHSASTNGTSINAGLHPDAYLYLGTDNTSWVYMTQEGGTWQGVSDERDKININNISTKKSLEFIKKINPVTFNFNFRKKYIDNQIFDEESYKQGLKQNKRKQSGFIAQNVYQSMISVFEDDNYAQIVNYSKYDNKNSEEDLYTMSKEALIPFLTGAIQEQQKQIESLNQTILQLQEEINSLKNNTSEVVENQEIITEE